MQEIEAKFLHIDLPGLLKKAGDIGFIQQHPRRILTREIYHLPHDHLKRYARIRVEGDGIVTCTIKIVDSDHRIDGVQEAEVRMPDVETAQHFLTMSGWAKTASQQTARELWFHQSKDVYLMFDEWPGIPPFLEIEGLDETSVQNTAQALGLNYADAVFGTVDQVYARYWGVKDCYWINKVPCINFENPPYPSMRVQYATSG